MEEEEKKKAAKSKQRKEKGVLVISQSHTPNSRACCCWCCGIQNLTLMRKERVKKRLVWSMKREVAQKKKRFGLYEDSFRKRNWRE